MPRRAIPRILRPTAFTMLELLVVLGIVLILIAILLPYIAKERERANRTRCAQNLHSISLALNVYQVDYNAYPMAAQDPQQPNGYTAYTGIDASNGNGVAFNDVTASLWLLVRTGYAVQDAWHSPHKQAMDFSLFVCPSSDQTADRLTDDAGRKVTVTQRGNFRGPAHLSYSYCSPFTNTAGFHLNGDSLHWNFPVMADRNPGITNRSDVTAPVASSPPLQMAKANSLNHDQAGQNVLYVDGEVIFQTTPFCGVDNDNIYTAASATTQPTTAPFTPSAHGVCTRTVGPATVNDSYLVPTESDK